ncbi:substrate-binding periplasmic protein [uncultured Bdellovibrio sp.]|uniref:substrate-binding periplasmic protein n=1 Tax=Bdellovibrio sp. HCB-162 TaxID=3394234 RepID=UPI0025E7CA36|nr:transporter substrate-binding domain-containing protein [uncultured Bdellovibrio sp.]
MKFSLVFLFLSSMAFAKPTPVDIGGYDFPPYVISKNNGFQGLTLDLIQLLNQKQSKFEFRFVPTSPSRRYHDMKEGRYQIIAFECKSWGWNPDLVTSTKIFQEGGEVFIALNEPSRTQAYFKDLKSKKIRGMRGYHYGFLGLSTGPKALKEFNLELTNTQEGNIRAVLNKRTDIAIVSKEYLDIYLKENPQDQKFLLISKNFDQIYRLGLLVSNEQSTIKVADLNKLIDDIVKDGSWDDILKRKGITSKHP